MPTLSKQTTRISHTVSVFNGQIIAINNRGQKVDAAWGGVTRFSYLGVDALIAAEIQTRTNYWTGTLYPKYLDPDTKAIVDGASGEVQTFMNSYRDYTNPVLDFIAASPLADHDDEVHFNLVLDRNRKDPSRLTQNIEAEVVLDVKAHGRGLFHCHARKPEDAIGRAHIPHEDGVNEVELAYHILPLIIRPGESTIQNLNEQQIIISNQIANPDTLRTRERFSRAIFDFHIGAEYSGHFVQIFTRWYNSHYPHFAGSWGEMITIVIP